MLQFCPCSLSGMAIIRWGHWRQGSIKKALGKVCNSRKHVSVVADASLLPKSEKTPTLVKVAKGTK